MLHEFFIEPVRFGLGGFEVFLNFLFIFGIDGVANSQDANLVFF
jgi:hypothetical protein